MSKEFKLPELGENIEFADIINVLVKPGDKIEQEQSIIEIETDKATIEVPSSYAGVVEEVLVKKRQKQKVKRKKRNPPKNRNHKKQKNLFQQKVL